MKKVLMIVLCLPLLFLSACSKEASTPHDKFMVVCKSFMQASKQFKQDMNQEKQSKADVSTKMATMMGEYYSKIQQPYGQWGQTCFGNLKQQSNNPDCTVLVGFVKKPACAQATETAYQNLQKQH